MVIRSLFTGVAMIALTIGSAEAQSRDPKHRQFDYFLPKAVAGAAVTQTITSCSDGAKPGDSDVVEIETVIDIDSKVRPDTAHKLTIDARSGFLSSRTTSLDPRADGTLASYNASSEGQGGPILSSILSAVGVAVTWATPSKHQAPGAVLQGVELAAVEKPILVCSKFVKDALAALAKTRQQIASLEALIVAGQGDDAKTELLARLRTRADALVTSLTLSAGEGQTFGEGRDYFLDTCPPDKTHDTCEKGEALPNHPARASWSGVIIPVNSEKWFTFKAASKETPATAGQVASFYPDLAGLHGFLVTLTPKVGLLDGFSGDGTKFERPDHRAVFYRRPVPAKIEVVPCLNDIVGEDAAATCQAAKSDQIASADLTRSEIVLMPQLSGLYSLSIGAGGLFGTRQAAIKFDDNGVPTSWEYGATPGAADIATTIDSAVATAIAVRDRRLNANTRRANEIKAENDLSALLAGK